MGMMGFRTSPSTRPGLQGALKLARLLEAPEKDLEALVRKLEADELFSRLKNAGVISLQPYPQARFSARCFAGRELRASIGEGLPELIDGRNDWARLISKIGEDSFKECFLNDGSLSDEQCARLCGISREEARGLKEFVDRLYIQVEFEDPRAQLAPAKVFSAVAGIALENGRPVLGFFNREIWKGRYQIDADKREALLRGASHREARRLENLLRQLEFLDRRKSTLYRVLEALIEIQADYLVTGDPDQRRPLTQRELAARLEIDPSVLNRLISNKSVQLPWGLEAPIGILLPSAKLVLKNHLYQISLEHPTLSDEGLRIEISRKHGRNLSRRSIAQYRKELGLSKERFAASPNR